MVSDPCFWNVWMVTALRPRAQVDDEDPTGNQTDTCKREQLMSEVRLGIDVACRADHRASLADDRGEFLWSSWRFRTTTVDLERLWAKIPEGTRVTVILEPTRNAWVPLAAWLEARGATVVLVPPEQSADLRDYYNKYTKTDRLDSRVLARLPMLHPKDCAVSTTWVPQNRCAGPLDSGPAWSSGAPPPASDSTPSSSCSDRVGPTRWARAAIPRRPWSC
jgi:hypothetical protein